MVSISLENYNTELIDNSTIGNKTKFLGKPLLESVEQMARVSF